MIDWTRQLPDWPPPLTVQVTCEKSFRLIGQKVRILQTCSQLNRIKANFWPRKLPLLSFHVGCQSNANVGIVRRVSHANKPTQNKPDGRESIKLLLSLFLLYGRARKKQQQFDCIFVASQRLCKFLAGLSIWRRTATSGGPHWRPENQLILPISLISIICHRETKSNKRRGQTHRPLSADKNGRPPTEFNWPASWIQFGRPVCFALFALFD